MKYLKDELYIFPGNEILWEAAFDRYWREFLRIKHKFPSAFVAAIGDGYGFHDSYLKSVTIEAIKPPTYNLTLLLTNLSFDRLSGEIYTIILSNISSVKTENTTDCYWLYSELLRTKKDRLSLEVTFSGEGKLYVEFEKLDYFCDYLGS